MSVGFVLRRKLLPRVGELHDGGNKFHHLRSQELSQLQVYELEVFALTESELNVEIIVMLRGRYNRSECLVQGSEF